MRLRVPTGRLANGFLVPSLAAVLLVGGCASSGGTSTSQSSSPGSVVTAVDTGLIDGSVAGSGAVPPSATAPPEPVGVPGVDDSVPLCAAWAVYSGSVQIIAVAHAFSDLTAGELAQLELIAAPSVVAAVARIGAAWPAELETDRSIVLDELLGRFARRAARGVAALEAAGFSADDIARAEQAWDDVLRARDPDNPGVELPATLDPLRLALGAAATQFEADNTPFDLDPSLVGNGSDAPRTRAYLAEQCPDLASSGVGDAL